MQKTHILEILIDNYSFQIKKKYSTIKKLHSKKLQQ